jgi:hypothetical protein
MKWINLAQDTDQWRALVNMVMNSCEHGNEPSDSITCCEVLE